MLSIEKENNSILDVMRKHDNISKYILLKYHYRCGKKIIGFSNQRYYNNSLNLSAVSSIGELELMDIKNQNIKQKTVGIFPAVFCFKVDGVCPIKSI